MQLIAADIGNSSIKIAMRGSEDIQSSDDRWVNQTIIRNSEALNTKRLDLPERTVFWSISSVNCEREEFLKAWVNENRPNDKFHVIQHDEIEIESNVESRTSVGRDRLLAAWMALLLADQSGPIVIVDAGTAVTVDLVDKNNIFQGGTIFLGGARALKALSSSTDALPDLTQRDYIPLIGDCKNDFIGKSTQEAIIRGVYQAQIGAIKHLVKRLIIQNPNATVYATGGGINDIQSGLPDHWNYVPDLVVRGAGIIGRRLLNQRTEEQ